MTDHRADPDFRALMATVRAAPKDDAPRLILADWLQEHDDEPWAAFIRWQVRNKQERQTTTTYGHIWWQYRDQGSPEYLDVHVDRSWMPATAISWNWTWERGFPHRVRLPAEELDSVLPLLLDEWPIREVVVVGGSRSEYAAVKRFRLGLFTEAGRGYYPLDMTDNERRRVRAAARELGRAKDKAAADRANWRNKMEAPT